MNLKNLKNNQKILHWRNNTNTQRYDEKDTIMDDYGISKDFKYNKNPENPSNKWGTRNAEKCISRCFQKLKEIMKLSEEISRYLGNQDIKSKS